MKWVWPDDGPFNDALAQWCAERIWPGQGRRLSGYRCMGVYDGQELVAVVVYHNWDRHSGVIEISGASTTPRWLTRKVLTEMYEAPFARLGCQMVVQRNSAENHRLNSILERLGFTGHCIPRLRGRDEDEIIYTLTREAWEGNGYHGQRHS